MLSGSELNRICAKRAKAIQGKLSSFPPQPPDPINDRFYKTLSLHSLWDEEKAPPDECAYFSFSIGYDLDSIASAVDSLELFESETIPIEIASFARTRVKISSFNEFTEYSDGIVTKKISANGASRDNYVEVLTSFPILTMITCLTSFMQSIYKASESEWLVDAECLSEVVNYDWLQYFSFSSQQKVFYSFCYWNGDMEECILKIFLSSGPSSEQFEKLRSLHEKCDFNDLIMMQKMADSNIETGYGENLADFWIRNLSLRKRKVCVHDEPESKKQKIE